MALEGGVNLNLSNFLKRLAGARSGGGASTSASESDSPSEKGDSSPSPPSSSLSSATSASSFSFRGSSWRSGAELRPRTWSLAKGPTPPFAFPPLL